jgi:dynein assembly factor 3
MDGLGSINWWGFTPALDLLLSCEQSGANTSTCELPGEVNILLIGAGDCRHILKTIAHSYRHSCRKINFYVIESSLELYARDMLFLNLMLEPQQKFGLQEKTELFLELYANSLVRSQSMDYVQQVSTELVKMVTDFDYLDKNLPIVDLSQLKFKERDMLEGIFKFWRSSIPFDISKCWELRLRQYLGVRYDAIPNVFDWDFHMKLAEKGAAIINSRNYNRWRHKGLAFEIREGTYDTPNRTLASGMIFKHDGERLARRGYWGDIIVSPYITFGIESEQQSFFKQSNNIYTKTSEDVAEYNILSMMHEVNHHTHYQPPCDSSEHDHMATLSEIPEEQITDELTAQVDALNVSKDEKLTQCANNFKVFLLPLNSTDELVRRSKFQKLFNIVYLSNSHSHMLKSELTSTFNPGATVVLDSAKFVLELTKDQQSEYVQKIVSLAESIDCKLTHSTDENNDAFLKFTYQPRSPVC